jgi:hypothetical protein
MIATLLGLSLALPSPHQLLISEGTEDSVSFFRRRLNDGSSDKKGKTHKVKRRGRSHSEESDESGEYESSSSSSNKHPRSSGSGGKSEGSKKETQQQKQKDLHIGGEGVMVSLSDEDLKQIARGGKLGGARHGVDKYDSRWVEALQEAIDPFLAKARAGMAPKDVLGQMRQDKIHLQGVRMFKRALILEQEVRGKPIRGRKLEYFGVEDSRQTRRRRGGCDR